MMTTKEPLSAPLIIWRSMRDLMRLPTIKFFFWANLSASSMGNDSVVIKDSKKHQFLRYITTDKITTTRWNRHLKNELFTIYLGESLTSLEPF